MCVCVCAGGERLVASLSAVLAGVEGRGKDVFRYREVTRRSYVFGGGREALRC